MPKKKQEETKPAFQEAIQDMTASEMLTTNFMPYAMSVIVSRAIPEIDGFKPSHRKLLYTMYRMGLLNGNRTKSANIAAQTMLLNPHGDASNYETMVRLTVENETLLTPFVDGKGSFGKHYSRDMAFAASRYTEAKLARVAEELFRGINKNVVDFVDNYDSTTTEPTLLPVTFPNILANPTQGIAVGLASNICSFNLKELCEATILRIKDPEADLLTVMPGPDFTTGGYLLYDDNIMRQVYKTGRGSIRLRAKYSYDKKENIIEITEIPYTTTGEQIIEGVVSLVKAGKIKEINDIRDETDRNGFKIAIDLKRGTDPDNLMLKLFKGTRLEDSFGCNFVVLINGTPKTLGVYDILDEWISWRRTCVVREAQFDLEKDERDLHLLYGLRKILLDIDKAIYIIRHTEHDADVIPNLMRGFDIDELQAEYVAEIKLRNLNKEYLLNRTADIDRLEKDIERLKKLIASKAAVNRVIISNLQDVIKKYGKSRKTEIIPFEENKVVLEVTVPDYNVKVFVTREGYVKKIPLTSLKTNPDLKMRDDDIVTATYDCDNRTELLLFSDQCNCYKIYTTDVRDCKPSEYGEYANNLVGMENGENLLFLTPMNEKAFLIIVFENGKVSRIPLTAYQTKLNRKKLVKAYSDSAKAVAMFAVEGNETFGIRTDNDRLLSFDSNVVPEKASKTAQGVQILRLMKNASIKDAKRFPEYNAGDAKNYHGRNYPHSGGKYTPV